MTRTYVNHVFATVTLTRDKDRNEAWSTFSSFLNRYIQRLRRFHGSKIEYIRTVEAHQDGFPHSHFVLQFHDSLAVDNYRYFDKALYQRWRAIWQHGHSDYQPPTGRTQPILYIVKYISKDTPTRRTLWRKMYQDEQSSKNVSSLTAESTTVPSILPKSSVSHVLNTDVKVQSAPTKADLTLFLCKQYKIKQLTWSRGFKFPRLDRKVVPLPSQCLLTPARR